MRLIALVVAAPRAQRPSQSTRRPDDVRGTRRRRSRSAAPTAGRDEVRRHVRSRSAASKLPSAARSQARDQPRRSQSSNLAQMVDARTWTSGGGNTFPGAEAPFGMVQWSPDTLPNRSAGGGYSFGDKTLDGYSLTHVSGPVAALPATCRSSRSPGRSRAGNPNNLTTPFTNAGEVAQAGYYSAQSNQPSTITSDFTATRTARWAGSRSHATAQAGFVVKLMDSQNGDSRRQRLGRRQQRGHRLGDTAATSAARPTTTGRASCTPSTST